MGYHRAGFEVVGVDNTFARLMRYPYEAHRADALEFLIEHGRNFDAIHASPPCTGYSRGTVAIPDRLTRYDRLIAATREALQIVGRPWVIENVEDARRELRNPLVLCWTHFNQPGSITDEDGTPLWMRRHRLFESNVDLWPADECSHPRDMQCAGAYGGARRDKDEARNVRHGGYVPSVAVMRELLGTPWMSEKGLPAEHPAAVRRAHRPATRRTPDGACRMIRRLICFVVGHRDGRCHFPQASWVVCRRCGRRALELGA